MSKELALVQVPELVDDGGLAHVGDADDNDGFVGGARPVVPIRLLNQPERKEKMV